MASIRWHKEFNHTYQKAEGSQMRQDAVKACVTMNNLLSYCHLIDLQMLSSSSLSIFYFDAQLSLPGEPILNSLRGKCCECVRDVSNVNKRFARLSTRPKGERKLFFFWWRKLNVLLILPLAFHQVFTRKTQKPIMQQVAAAGAAPTAVAFGCSSCALCILFAAAAAGVLLLQAKHKNASRDAAQKHESKVW